MLKYSVKYLLFFGFSFRGVFGGVVVVMFCNRLFSVG